MRPFAQDLGNEGNGLRADLGGPSLQSLGRELRVVAVLCGHVGCYGGVSSRLIHAPMTGHPLASMEALDGCGGDAHIELTLDEVVRHGVVMALHFDVIIDMNTRLLPFGVFIGGGR